MSDLNADMHRRSFLAGAAKLAAIPALAALAGGVLAEPASAHTDRTPRTRRNERIVRRFYRLAEDMDMVGWVAAFTHDGTYTDMSVPRTYRGPKELRKPVEVMARAFPDLHREVEQVYVIDHGMVIVQLRLQGTHLGTLVTPDGTFPATGKRIDAPCGDVFEIVDGRIKRFDSYPEGLVIARQIGV
ncbi:nuclear transport factor 2 family protein [Streptomyces sp. NPDC058683]|uniref:nuclear transport factor 2 family protein n=1 Tax=Streptomyces sp. NPDC058683 TaxID=3346597 RepID=UPI003665997A